MSEYPDTESSDGYRSIRGAVVKAAGYLHDVEGAKWWIEFEDGRLAVALLHPEQVRPVIESSTRRMLWTGWLSDG